MNVTLQVGVKILLKNSEGKYLLLRRNPKKYPEMPPVWDLVGGRIEPGRPLLENLQREILEETGLNFPAPANLVAAQDILRVEGRHVVRLTYEGEVEGQPEINEESLEHKWYTKEELLGLKEGEVDIYFMEILKQGKFVL